jgi:hypothetical protein
MANSNQNSVGITATGTSRAHSWPSFSGRLTRVLTRYFFIRAASSGFKRKVAEQNGICAICQEEFTDYNDVVPDHKNPKGMGGAFRDDHPDNIQVVHYWCNSEKGSMRMEDSACVARCQLPH